MTGDAVLTLKGPRFFGFGFAEEGTSMGLALGTYRALPAFGGLERPKAVRACELL